MKILRLLVILLGISCVYGVARADSWNLPSDLSDRNTRVQFKVDSTWHMVEGTTAHVSGRAWLADSKDKSSVRAEIAIPISSFDTGRSSRDEKLREVMHAERNPQVVMKVTRVLDTCVPEEVRESAGCAVTLQGTLSMSGVTKEVDVPALIDRRDQGYVIHGEFSLKWAEYGIEDPSILVARLDPVATVSFEIILEPKENSHA